MKSQSSGSSSRINDKWMDALRSDRKRPRRRAETKKSGPAPCQRYRDVLMKAVSRPIDTPPTTLPYRLSVAIVGILMLMMPLLYLAAAIMSIVVYYWHCTSHLHLVTEGIVGILLFIVPAFFGPFVIFYLLKPFFVRGTAGSQPLYLSRDAEPELHEYVEQLCRSVNAPAPDRICINLLVNASASFSTANPFSRKLTLTIGLPLIYRLTLRQLSGVLAHEFGHFSQRFGMRFSYFVRVIGHWLSTALTERDSIDEWLEFRLDGPQWHLRIARWLLYTGASVARSFLWCFLMISNALSCLLIRQMELDADKVEVALVGDRSFATTHRRIMALGVAEQLAHDDLHDFYEEGRLVDDFSRLVATSLDDMPARLKKAIDEHESREKAGWFDTHPDQQARFDNAKAHGGPGVFTVPKNFEKVAASILFRDVSQYGEECTRTFYEAVLGRRFKEGLLYPIHDLLERRKAETTAAKTLHRYFQVHMPPFYPFPISEDAADACDSPAETLKELKSERRDMVAAAKGYRDLIERHALAEQNRMESAAMEFLEGVNVRVHRDDPARRHYSVAEFARLTEQGLGNLALDMLDYEAAAGRRISAALRLVTHEKVYSKLKDGVALRDDAEELVTHTLKITDLMGDLRGLRVMCQNVVASLNHIDGNLENEAFLRSLFNQIGSLYEMIKSLHWEMGSCEYPFDHAEGDKSLQEFAMPELPPENDPYGMLYVSRIAFERLATTQMRLFARLAVIAEKVETQLGLPRLPDYDPAAEESDSTATAAAAV